MRGRLSVLPRVLVLCIIAVLATLSFGLLASAGDALEPEPRAAFMLPEASHGLAAASQAMPMAPQAPAQQDDIWVDIEALTDGDPPEWPPYGPWDTMVQADPPPNTVYAGEELVYWVGVWNDHSEVATDTVVVVFLPYEIQYLADTDSCSEIGTYENGIVYGCDLGDLAPYESVEFEIKTRVHPWALVDSLDGYFTGTITATAGAEVFSDLGSGFDEDAVFIQDSADLSVVKMSKPDTEVEVDEVFTYTIFVENLGPSFARGAAIRDEILSSGAFELVDAWSDRGPCMEDEEAAHGVTLFCWMEDETPFGFLEPKGFSSIDGGPEFLFTSGRWIITATVRALEAGDINNVVNVFTVESEGLDNGYAMSFIGTPDPDLSNNQAQDFIHATDVADLSLTKVASAQQVVAGTSLGYALTVSNTGPSPAENVVVKDFLPAGVIVDSIFPSQGSCTVGTPGDPFDPLTCNLGTLAASGTVAWVQVNVTVEPDYPVDALTGIGPLDNDATVSSDTFDPNNSNDRASTRQAVYAEADLGIIKLAEPPLPARDYTLAGGLVTYIIAVTNEGPSTAGDVRVFDRIPARASYVSDTLPGSGQCEVVGSDMTIAGFPIITAGSLRCDLGDLDPGEFEEFSITLRVDSDAPDGLILNLAIVASLETPEADFENNTDQAVTVVRTEADLEIAKTSQPVKVNAGEQVRYTLEVTNHGPSDARNVTVTDTLPMSATYEIATEDCSLVGSEPDIVVCDLMTVTVGEIRTFDIWAQVDPSALGTITNTAEVTGTIGLGDPNEEDNRATAKNLVEGLADLSVVKMSKPDTHVRAGELFTYTIFVDNLGPSWARNVIITDTVLSSGSWQLLSCDFVEIPAEYDSTSLTCMAPSLNVLVATIDPLPARSPDNTGRFGVNVVLLANEAQDVNNIVTVVADTADPDMSNNRAEDFISVTAVADLSLVKEVTSSGPYVAGGTATFRLRATNNGPSTAENVVIKDYLPHGVSVAGIVAPGSSCTAGTPGSPFAPLTCNVGTLDDGATATVWVTVRIDPEYPVEGLLGLGRVRNDAVVSSDTFDDENDDNRANASVVFRAEADLGLIKLAEPVPPLDHTLAGGLVTYPLIVINQGPSTARDVRVFDRIPAGASYVSDTLPGDGHCEIVGGDFTIFGFPLITAGSLRCDLGDLDPGEIEEFSVTLRVDSDVPDGSTLVNFALVASLETAEPDFENLENNFSSAPILVLTEADLEIEKTSEPDKVNAGEQKKYTLRVTNHGPSDAQEVIVIDYLPPEVEYELDTDDCSVTSTDPTTGQQTVTCNKGTLTAEDTWEFNIWARVRTDVLPGTIITNVAGVMSEGETVLLQRGELAGGDPIFDRPRGEKEGMGPAPVTTCSDSTSDGVRYDVYSVALEGSTSIAVRAQGAGVGTLYDPFVVVYDASFNPASPCANFVAAADNGGAGLDTSFVVNLDPGTYDIVVAGYAAGYLGTYEIEVSTATTHDPDVSNNVAERKNLVLAEADLRVTKYGVPNGPVEAGQNLTYTVIVENLGPSAAHLVELRDVLESSGVFSLTSVIPDALGNRPGATCAPVDGPITELALEWSTDQSTWFPVDGELPAFGMVLTPTNPYHYIDVASLTADPALDGGYFPFYMDPGSAPAGFYTYWAAKGVTEDGTGPWQPHMWNIINGVEPMFYLWVNGGPYMLVDGLQRDVFATDQHLRVNGDYPLGTYEFDGTIAAGGEESNLTIWMTFSDAGPVVVVPGPTLSCDLAALEPIGPGLHEGRWMIKLVLTADETQSVTNVADVLSADPDPDYSNNHAEAAHDITDVSDLEISKSALGELMGSDGVITPTIDAVTAGRSLTYTIVITNHGPSTAENVEVYDRLPPGVVVTGATASQGVCSTGTPGDPLDRLVCGIGLLAPESPTGTATITITAMVDPAAADGSILENDAFVVSDIYDPNNSNDYATNLTAVSTAADVSVEKTGSPDPVVAGEQLKYTFVVTNAGPSVARDVMISDTLPAELTGLEVYVVNEPGATCHIASTAPNAIDCGLGDMAVGKEIVIVAATVVDSGVYSGTTIVNSVEVSSATADPDTTYDTDEETTTVHTQADLEIEKTSEPAKVYAGEQKHYTIEVTNHGPSDAHEVTVTDRLPPEAAYEIDTHGCTVTGSGGGETLTCTDGTLKPGDTWTFEIWAVVNAATEAGATITNTAEVTGSTYVVQVEGGAIREPIYDPDPTNNLDTARNLVLGRADLKITKFGKPDGQVRAGENLTYTVIIDNLGPGYAHDVELRDVLVSSGAFSVTSVTADALGNRPGATCAPVPGVMTGLDLDWSTDEASWFDVDGTLPTFGMLLDPADTYYYINVDHLTATASLDNGYHPFYLDPDSVPAGFYAYWAARGVTASPALPWQAHMWEIINGQEPMFYLRVTAGPSYMLVDGLRRDGTFEGDHHLRVNGDYPLGTYEFDGTITAGGEDSSLTVWMTFSDSGPLVVDPGLLLSCDLDALEPVGPGLNEGRWIVQVVVTADETQDLNNIADVLSADPDPDWSNNRAMVMHEVTDVSDLEISKSALGELMGSDGVVTPTVDAVTAGRSLTYTIVITNHGPSTAENVDVHDRLPPGVVVTGVEASQGSCETGTPGDPLDELVCGLGLLPTDAPTNTATITITVDVDPGVPDGSLLENDAFVVSDIFDLNNDNDQAHNLTVVSAAADVQVEKTGLPDPVIAGEQLEYTFVITNAGPSVARDVRLYDEMPDELTAQEIYVLNQPGATCNIAPTPPNAIDCGLGDVAAGDVIVVVATTLVETWVPDGRTIYNRVDVSALTMDPDTENNTYIDDTLVHAMADLTIEKTSDPMKVYAGEQKRYTIEVTNLGPSDAQEVVVTDTLPAEVEYEIDTDACQVTGTGIQGEQILACSGGTLEPGDRWAFDIWARVKPEVLPGTIITNVARVTSASGDSETNTFNGTLDPGDPTFERPKGEEETGGVAPVVTCDLSGEHPYYEVHPLIYAKGPTNIEVIGGTLFDPFVVVYQAGTFNPANPCFGFVAAGDNGTEAFNPNFGIDLPEGFYDIVVTAYKAGYAGTYQLRVTSSAGGDPDLSNNEATSKNLVLGKADLKITKFGKPDGQVRAGELLTYTVIVDNLGPGYAHNVVLTDVMQSDLSFELVSWSSDRDATCSPDPGIFDEQMQLQCELTDPLQVMSPTVSGRWILHVVVTAEETQDLNNIAYVLSSDFDPDPSNNQAEVMHEVTDVADLEVAKSAVGEVVQVPGGAIALTPDGVTAGRSLTYTVVITNHGPSPAENVVLEDRLPPGVVVTGVSLSQGSCDTGTPGEPLDKLTCGIGTLAPDGSATVTIFADVDPNVGHGSILENDALVYSDIFDPASGNDYATNMTAVSAAADLRVEKTDRPDYVLAGQQLEYTFVVTNTGPSVARDVVLHDELPVELRAFSVYVVNGPGASCSIATTPNYVVDCGLGDMAVGKEIIIVVSTRVDSAVPDSTVITNEGEVSSPTADPVMANNTEDEDTLIQTQADLGIVKTSDPDKVFAGEQKRYTIEVTNHGPSDALNVTVTDTLPDDLTYEIDTDDCSVTGGPGGETVTCHGGTLKPGETWTFDIWARVHPATLPGTELHNEACVTGETTLPDPVSGNNCSTIKNLVLGKADLKITKFGKPDGEVRAGDLLTYTVIVDNLGPGYAHNVVITDVMQSDLTFELVSVSSDRPYYCTPTPGFFDERLELRCELAHPLEVMTPPANGRWILTVVVTADETQDINNVARVSTSDLDPNPENNQAEVMHEITDVSDLEITKSALGEVDIIETCGNTILKTDEVVAGRMLYYTLVITNHGPSTAENVVVLDRLPAGVTVYAADASQGSCGTGTPGNPLDRMTCGLGTIPSGASATIEIEVFVDPGMPQGSILENDASVYSDLFDPTNANNQATNLTVVRTEAELEVEKADRPDPVLAGEQVEYTITARNAGPSVARDVVIIDQLPAALRALEANVVDVPFATCSIRTTVPNIVDCGFGDMEVGQEIDVILTALVLADTAPGVVTNTVSITSTTHDPYSPNNTVPQTTTVETRADLIIAKTAQPQKVYAGEQKRYTITVYNDGPSDAQNVVVTDTLPSDVAYEVDTDNCEVAFTDPATGQQTLTCSNGTLKPGQTWAFDIWARVHPATLPDTIITNMAEVTGTTSLGDPNLEDNTATAKNLVLGKADLKVTKFGKPDEYVRAGESLTYTVIVDNLGTGYAHNVVITDVLQSSGTFELVSVTSDRAAVCTPESGVFSEQLKITCGLTNPLEVMTPQASGRWILTIVVTADETQDINNVARVSSSDFDPNLENNQAETQHAITDVADLEIAKSALGEVQVDGSPGGTVTLIPDRVTAGRYLTYTLVITNHGPSTAENVEVRDRIPAGVTVIAAESSQGECETGTPGDPLDRMVCGLGTIEADGVVTVTVLLRADPALPHQSILENDATVSSDLFDPTNANNLATNLTVVLAAADIDVTKSDRHDPVTAGEQVEYTITTRNVGPSVARDVSLWDELPPELAAFEVSVVDAPNASCSILTTLPTIVDCNLGDMMPGKVIDVIVTAMILSHAEAGVVTNTVEVESTTHDPYLINNTAQETTTILTAADLGVTKTSEPQKVYAGEQIEYIISVTNYGPSGASNVVVYDQLPAETDYEVSTAACVESEPGGLTCSLGSIPADTTVSFKIWARVRPDVIPGTIIVNSVRIASSVVDSDSSNNSASAETLVMGKADLKIAKFGKPDGQVGAGQYLTYTVIVDNLGTGYAHDVVVADLLQSSGTFELVSVASDRPATCSPELGSFSGQLDLTCSLDDPLENISPLSSGRWRLTVVITADEDQDINNVARVSSSDYDPNLANNDADVEHEITRVVDLALTKSAVGQVQVDGAPAGTFSAVANEVTAGGSVTYTLLLTNHGPSTAENVTVLDQVPSPVVVKAATSSQGHCTTGIPGNPDAPLTCNVDTLRRGRTVTITIVAYVPPSVAHGSVVENDAMVTSALFDAHNGNNLASNLTDVSGWADLVVTKAQIPETVIPGGKIGYRITVVNHGPSDAPRSVISDTMPAEVQGTSWTCTAYEGASCPTGGTGSVAHSVDLPVNGKLVYEIFGTLRGRLALLPVTNTVTVSTAVGMRDPVASNSTDTTVNVPYLMYLPKLRLGRTWPSGPDLVIESLTAGSRGLELVIRNQGDAPVVDPFWVDVYIDPEQAPTHVNEVWHRISEQGLVWSIEEDGLPLPPHHTMHLTVGDKYYWPGLSDVSWPLSPDTVIYAQVDSYGDATFGAVAEVHEIAGWLYNNIEGPVSPSWAGAASTPTASNPPPREGYPESLPRRP